MSNTSTVGRPKNATVKDLDTLRSEMRAEMRDEMREAMKAVPPFPAAAKAAPVAAKGSGHQPTMRELFFAHLLGATLGSIGFEAFSDMFLESLVNNSEKIWKTYQAIVTGEREAMLQTQIDAAVKARQEAEASLAQSKRIIAEQAGLISREANDREADGTGDIDTSLADGIEGEELLEEASI